MAAEKTVSFLSITKEEFAAAGKVVPHLSCFLQEGGSSIKTGQKAKNWRAGRVGEHRAWADCKAWLAFENNLYRQPPGNSVPASLGSQTKCSRTLAAKGKVLQGGEKPGKPGCCMTDSCQQQLPNFPRLCNAVPRLCPPHCKADGGGGKHSACTPLLLLYPRTIHKVE